QPRTGDSGRRTPCGFNPCSSGSQSSTRPAINGTPPLAGFQSLFFWISVLNNECVFLTRSPLLRFNPCPSASQSSTVICGRHVNTTNTMFQSLFFWISVLNTFSRKINSGRSVVSILVLLDLSPQPPA